MLPEINDLSEHMFWADMKVWSEINKMQNKDTKNIFDLFFHLHMVQHVYLCIWKNEPIDHLEKIEFHKLQEVYEWGMDFHQKNRLFVNDLDANYLNKEIEIPWGKQLEKILGKPPANSNLLQTIYQVIMHSTYHRGQINKEVRRIGGEPPLIDFIYWIWLSKPEAETIRV